jgi:hypothetical protein
MRVGYSWIYWRENIGLSMKLVLIFLDIEGKYGGNIVEIWPSAEILRN